MRGKVPTRRDQKRRIGRTQLLARHDAQVESLRQKVWMAAYRNHLNRNIRDASACSGQQWQDEDLCQIERYPHANTSRGR